MKLLTRSKTRELVDQEQQAMVVPLLLGTVERHPLSQSIDHHREHEPDQTAKPDLVGRGHHKVQRYREVAVHEIIYGEVARRRVPSHEWIAIKRQRRFRG